MGRDRKVLLPESHPLWQAARDGRKAYKQSTKDPAVQSALALADQVTDILDTGGEIQLKDKAGVLQTVKIKGLHEH